MAVQLVRLNAPKYWLRVGTPDCNPSQKLSILWPLRVASCIQSLNYYCGSQSYIPKIEAVDHSELLVPIPHITNHFQRQSPTRIE
jgi:hypothetical protein